MPEEQLLVAADPQEAPHQHTASSPANAAETLLPASAADGVPQRARNGPASAGPHRNSTSPVASSVDDTEYAVVVSAQTGFLSRLARAVMSAPAKVERTLKDPSFYAYDTDRRVRIVDTRLFVLYYSLCGRVVVEREVYGFFCVHLSSYE